MIEVRKNLEKNNNTLNSASADFADSTICNFAFVLFIVKGLQIVIVLKL